MRLKEIRESRNMSQGLLSTLTGLAQPYICQLERGQRYPSMSTLIKLSKALGCTIDELIGPAAQAQEVALSQ